MKGDNPFIGMTPKELNDYLDDLSKEKPGRDDSPMMSDFLFKRNKPAGQRFSANGDTKTCSYCGDSFLPIEDEDFCCDACELGHHEENEIEADEDDCPDEDEEIEILAREEKKGKCF